MKRRLAIMSLAAWLAYNTDALSLRGGYSCESYSCRLKREKVSEEARLAALSSINGKDFWDILASLGPLAVILSAAVALIVGFRAINTQRRVARNRATLDVLFRLESDAVFLKASHIFQDVRDGRGLLSLLGDPESKKTSNRDKEEELYVDTYLNHLELICVGMSEDTIDELYVFQYMRGTFIHDWHSAKPYIAGCRKQSGNNRLYEKFEKFATSWDEAKVDTLPQQSRPKFVTRSDDPRKYLESNTGTYHIQS